MPLFQPSNITPSSFAGVGGGTIAVENPIEITWQVNGNVAMTAFKIDIYDVSNNRIGGSDIVKINNFYPIDGKGNPRYYKYKPANVWSDWGLANGNDYILQITQYWGGETDGSHSVVQLSQSAFNTRTTPTLSIKTSSGATVSVVETAVQAFQGIYEQAQGDSIDWVRWQLIDSVSGSVISDTGIVNTQVLNYTAENLQSGNTYTVICTVQTENGVVAISESTFFVEYELKQIEGSFTLNVTDKTNNLLQWDKISVSDGDDILGISNSLNYSFNDGKLILGKNATVKWENKNDGELNIETPWVFAWSARGGGLTNRAFEEEIKKETEYSSKITYNPHTSNGQRAEYAYSKFNNLFYCITYDSRGNTVLQEISNDVPRGFSVINYTSTLYAVSASSLNNLIAVGGGHNLMFANEGTTYNVLIIKDNFGAGEKVLGLSVGGASFTVESVLFSNDGSYFAVATTRQVWLYKVAGNTFNLIGNTSYSFTDNYTVSLSFNKDSTLLAVGGDKIVKVFKISENSIESLYTISEDIKYPQVLFNPKTDVLVVNSYVYTAGEEKAEYIGTLPVNISNSISLLGFDESGSTLFVEENNSASTTTKNRTTKLYEIYFIGARFESKSTKDFSFTVSDYKYGTYGGAIGGGRGICAGCDFTYEIENRLIYNRYWVDCTIYKIDEIESNADVKIEYTDTGISINERVETPIEVFLKLNIYYLDGEQKHTQKYFEVATDTLNIVLSRNDAEFSLLYGESIIKNIFIPPNIENVVVHINASKAHIILDGVSTVANIDASKYPQENIKSIEIYGKQECEYVYVSNESAEWTEMFSPSWTENTVFLTNFNFNSLQAGKIEGVDPIVDIYRENVLTGEFIKLYSCSNEVEKFRDFSWILGERYNYYGYIKLDNKYVSANPFSESYVCRNQPYYLLLITEQDEEQPNAYHVVTSFRFGNNMQGGSITNNNTPNFLTNFTEYRTKQPSSRMSKSGTLQALLSNTVHGEYKDTTQQMENLFAISKCRNPMFLKDMKGNLYMVTISAPITQTINIKSAQQEVTVSIPWEEIGSAKGASIMQVPTDKGWVSDNALLEDVVLSVDEYTGMLIVEYPSKYNSTTFNLRDNLLLANTNSNFEQPNLILSDSAVKLILED